MFSMPLKALFALCLVMAQSALASAQIGVVPVNIHTDTSPSLTVTKDGVSTVCTEVANPDWNRTSTFTLLPQVGDTQTAHSDFVCGDVHVLVDHEISVTRVGRDGTDDTLLHATEIDSHFVASVSYEDGNSISVFDTAIPYRLSSFPAGYKSVTFDSGIPVLPRVRIDYIKEYLTWEFGG